jgi:hypothetical protein
VNSPNPSPAAPGPSRSRLLKLTGVLLLVQAVFVAAFVLPAHKPEPHDVPIGLVGPATPEHGLEQKQAGRLDVKRYASESAARGAIDQREIYGAVVVEGRDQRLLVASAASNSVAQMLRGAVDAQAGKVVVEDVKPLVDEDPRGTTLNSAFLALIIASSIAVVMLTSLAVTGLRLIGALSLFALLGGLAVIGLIGEGIGALPGSYLALSGVTALTMLAIALPTAGLQRLFGQAGAAIGGLFFVLLANPASGNASAPELLPGFWRQISQLMPPGAGGTSLRNTAYFDGNAILHPLLVLSAYAATGLLLVLLGGAVRQRRTQIETASASAPSDLSEPELDQAA